MGPLSLRLCLLPGQHGPVSAFHLLSYAFQTQASCSKRPWSSRTAFSPVCWMNLDNTKLAGISQRTILASRESSWFPVANSIPSEQSNRHTHTHTHTCTEATSKLLPTTRQLGLVTSTAKGHQGILFIVKTEQGINVTFGNSRMLCTNSEDFS